ncbi:MAG: hypothetical protein IPP46_09365 [Bacteroidetes bacterium]|nr:hypothetical protein [Bacteroidota bacterium]
MILYDFDRCAGTLSFKDRLFMNRLMTVRYLDVRFLQTPATSTSLPFTTFTNMIFLLHPWIRERNTLALSMAFTDPFPNYFYRMQLAPDNKIYMVCWGGSRFLHVINDPDQPDTNCNFVQHQLQLISYHGSSIPSFPYYRLGAAVGSGCDTLTVGLETENNSSPTTKSYYANNSLYIQLGKVQTDDMPYSIFSSNGQSIQNGILPAHQGTAYKVDLTAGLSAGVYLFQLGNDESAHRNKFVVISSW